MIKTENFHKLEVSSAGELRAWLQENNQQKESIWLITYKKCVPEKYLSTGQVLDELLCFGWIDGIRRKLDQKRTMQLISPRSALHWTQSYKNRATKLIEQERMQASGFRAIQKSQQAGLWSFMEDVDRLMVPSDLSEALKQFPGASEFFNSINDSSKRNALRWIKLAKTAVTRKKRIMEISRLASMNKKLPGS